MMMSRLAVALIASCVPGARASTVEVQVRDGAGQPVADAGVYAIPVAAHVPEARGRAVAIEQIDREFVPYVTVLQAGTSATFPNRDPIMHHVYSFSSAKSFEIKLYSGKPPHAVLFDKPGVVTLGCNVHDWMVGYVLVVPTPYFAKTDANGEARLRDLPGGSYQVRAWHPQQRGQAAPFTVAVEPNTMQAAEVTIDTVARKPKYKPPLDRLKY
jgi:plastocyanin